MATQTPPAANDASAIANQLLSQEGEHAGGLKVSAPLDARTERRINEIEMIGEETAAAMPAPSQTEVTGGMRYLHSSRTIHQLVTDRNWAVGLYLAVATLLFPAPARCTTPARTRI